MQQVQITDGTIDANVEGSGHGLTCSRAVHYRVKHSNGWISSHLFAEVAAAASVYFLIKTGSSLHPHGNFTVSTEAQATIEFYENPTLSANRTGLAENNFNRETPTDSATTCFHTPTVTTDGTLMEINLLGAEGKFCDIGGTLIDRGYWLLKLNEDYLIKVTNNHSQDAQDIAIAYVWHEHAGTFDRHPPDKP